MIPTDFIFLFIIRVVFFMNRDDPSPILFYFYFFIRSELVRVDPSWSDPDWRSELIRSDFCTCLLPILVLLVRSLAGILPIVLVLFGWRDASFGILATILACGAAGPRVAYSVDIVDCAQARHICNVLFPEPLSANEKSSVGRQMTHHPNQTKLKLHIL